MPRHSVVERSRIAFSIKIFLETAPVEAANSASNVQVCRCAMCSCHDPESESYGTNSKAVTQWSIAYADISKVARFEWTGCAAIGEKHHDVGNRFSLSSVQLQAHHVVAGFELAVVLLCS